MVHRVWLERNRPRMCVWRGQGGGSTLMALLKAPLDSSPLSITSLMPSQFFSFFTVELLIMQADDRSRRSFLHLPVN